MIISANNLMELEMKSFSLLISFMIFGNICFAKENLVTNMAADAGVKSCLETVKDLNGFFGGDNDIGAWAFWSEENTDKQPFNVTLEQTYTDESAIVDFTVSPTPDGFCTYTYTRTWYSQSSCTAVSREDFLKDAKYKGEVNKNLLAFDNKGVKFLLTSAGTGCLVQKKEIGFRHNKIKR